MILHCPLQKHMKPRFPLLMLKYRSDDSLMPSIPIDEAEIDLTQQTKIQPLTSFTKTEGQYPAVEITAE